MRTAIYARKSTSKLGQKDTIENQIKICRRKAEELGLEIVDIKTDTATGTDDNNRQEVKDLIKGAVDGKYECVIMKGVSRLYRDVEKGLGLVKKLDRSDIRVVTVEEGFDSLEQKKSGTLDTGMLTMHLVFAENESKKIASRIKHTQIEKAHAGEWNQAGSIPFGYTYNPTTKKLEIDYSKSEVVKLIFNLYIDGLGMKTIAHYLNGDNLEDIVYPSPKGGLWNQYTIGFMLKNSVYAGDIVYNKRSKKSRPYKNPESIGKTDDDVYTGNDYNPTEKWIISEDAHISIIEREKFNKVQKIIETKGIRTGIKQSVSLLAGLAKCDKCGGGMTYKKGSKKDENGKVKTKSNYYCMSYIKYGKRYCTSHHILAEELEDFVISELKSELESKTNLKDSTSNLKKGTNHKSTVSNMKKVEKDIEQLSRKTNALLEKNLEGTISDAQYKMLNQKFSDELNLLINQLEKLKLSHAKLLTETSNENYLSKQYKEVKNLKVLPKETQRYILLDLINKISFNEGKIEIEYHF